MAFSSASTACINYHFGGHIKFRMAAALIASMLELSPLGSYVSAVANRDIVFVVFFVLLLAGGSTMLFYRRRYTLRGDSADISKRDYALGVPTEGLIRFLSGHLGIGGGILVGPFLLLRDFAAKDVSGTSSFFVVCSAVTGFLIIWISWVMPMSTSITRFSLQSWRRRSPVEFSARTFRGSN
jgi:uncharacterized membrane protein YfcA